MMTQDKFAVQDILLEVKERLRQQALLIPMSKTSKELLEIKNEVSRALNLMAIQRDRETYQTIHKGEPVSYTHLTLPTSDLV